ncbi:MAG: ABC transporter ATP-binding protein [Lagierella massiliensis]|nr:ABC transporter ATP-binding protein [Lagierella massiliensis]
MNKNKKIKFRKGTGKLIYSTVAKVKFSLTFGIILSLLATFAGLISPIILKRLIDVEISPKIGIVNPKTFILVSVLYMLSILLTNVLNYLKVLQLKKTSNKAAHRLREDLYFHTLNLPLSYFDKTPVGKISSRVVSDIDQVKEIFFYGFSTAFSSISFIIGSIVYVMTQDIVAGLILIVPIPIMIFLIIVYNKYSAKLHIGYRENRSKITSDLNENLNGISIIRAFGVTKEAYDEFKESNEKLYRTGLKIEIFDSLFSWNLSDTLMTISTALIVFLVGRGILRDDPVMTIGFMILLIQYNQNIYDNITNTLRRMNVLEKALGSAHHIVEVLDEELEYEGKEKLPHIEGEVEFKNVNFSYKKGTPVLNNISFYAPKGSKTALVGDTGSGKSSIINLIFRFYNIDSGQILIDKKDISLFKSKELRKHMSLVLQDPFIFKNTLRNNIDVSSKYSDEKILQALDKAGGSYMYSKLKEGLDSKLHGEGVGLSLGEKQIVTFARTILTDPKILVLDEATASIDTETEEYIQMGLKNLMKDRTSFIVAHRLSTIKNCDQIIVLEKGKIVEVGTHDKLLKNKGKYYELIEKAKKDS